MTSVNNKEARWKPTALLVMYQLIYSLMTILMKLAAHDGMDLKVASTYRFMFGAASMVPIAFFFERNKRPKLTWNVVILAFLCGLFGGTLAQILLLESLVLTSATFASAMTNLIPATTFLVVLCMRLESLGWHTNAGKAKVFGTLIGVGGAMLFSFYNGPNVTIWKTNVNLLNITTSHHRDTSTHKTYGSNNDQVVGAMLAFLSCVFASFWLIFQRDWNEWKLGWNIRLITVAFSGIIGTTVLYTLLHVAITMRGPLFASGFSPLLVVIVAIVGSLVLEEVLNLGSLLGGLLIICGLYIICWGKSQEIKMKDNRTVPCEQGEGSVLSEKADKSAEV
ncbi:OLC1v1035168C3 [Oldenlandia corymbosa var. corymbosa]|uniref:WAT1-related protein n=1 Tax=Oldenlandia corymbosa var. corymbosa TaxID=529605 RepID=A0AAV1CU37_OLDCO|nr:OLC1v1035168C3 [Oldenlandia corymbosa var. corymbosa]